MDNFLEIYNLPRRNQKEINNLNRLITSSEIDFVIKKNSQQTKVQYWMASQGNSSKHIRRANIYLYHTIPKSWTGGNTTKSILWGDHYLDTKTRQRHQKKENYRPIFLMNIDANILNKTLTNWIQQYMKRIIMIKWDLFNEQKVGIISTNQSMWYITLTNWRLKTIWSSQ